MQRAYDTILAAGASVLVITFEPPARIPLYMESHKWPFPIVSDPSREAYRAFGLGSAGWLTLLGPKVIQRYAGLMMKGYRPAASQADVHQLGGDFVLDATGRIVFVHRSTEPSDRPILEILLKALQVTSRARPREA